MVWIIYGRIKVRWKCISIDGYISKIHVVEVIVKDTYEKKPVTDINVWLQNRGEIIVGSMCRSACQSLSTSVYCSEESKDVEIIYTSQVLV